MPTIPLSPERNRLSAAIEEVASAVARVERVREAKVRAWQIGTRDAVEAAERAVVEARRAEASAVLSGLLGDDAPPRLSIAEAERALAEALSTRTAAEQARTALLQEEESAALRLGCAEGERAAATGAVVRADLIFAAVFAEFEAAQQRAADLRAIVQLLPGKTVAEANQVLFKQYEASGRGVAQFKAAIQNLAIDPAAPLPTLDAIFGDEPTAAAAAKAA